MGKKAVKRPETIVDQLRAAIRASGLTSYRLGKEAKVGQPIIDRFLNGERMPRLDTAARLAAVLRLELKPKG